MYNLKDESTNTFLIGIISYLYLFSSLVNNNFGIIFIYFAILLAGYLIVGMDIYKYNLIIIIFDILYSQTTFREGNFESKFNAGKSNAESNDNFTKEGGSIEIDGVEEDGANELVDDFDKKNEKNQKHKEESKLSM